MSKRKSLFSRSNAGAGIPMIIDIDTTDVSSADSAADAIIIPFVSGLTVDFDIDWGDLTALESYTDTNIECSHTYAVGGTYTISLYPKGSSIQAVAPISFNYADANRRDYSKYFDISQFGDVLITNYNNLRGFFNCVNLDITATDIEAGFISNITNANEVLRNTNVSTLFNSANWDVSGIMNFNGMFHDCTNLDIDVTNWDVSNSISFQSMFFNTPQNYNTLSWSPNMAIVTSMGSMFTLNSAYNRDVTNLNPLGNTMSLAGMFNSATSFTGVGLDTWDVSGATSLASFASGGTPINFSLIEGWNVGNVTSLQRTFFSNVNFTTVDLSGWNISNVTKLFDVFGSSANANPNVTGWTLKPASSISASFMFRNTAFTGVGLSTWTNTSSITNTSQMFIGCTALGVVDLSSWDMSNVTSMSSMFNGCTTFNPSGLFTNVSSATSIAAVFNNCPQFNSSAVSSWVLNSAVTDIGAFFNGCDIFNQDVSGLLGTANITDFGAMFSGALAFNQDISSWDFSSATIMTDFGTNWGMSTPNYDLLLSSLAGQTLQSGLTTTMSSQYTPGIVDSGTTDGTTANKLIDSTQNFLTTVAINDIVYNTTDLTYAKVTAVDSDTTLSLDNDIMVSGETYDIQGSQVAKDRYVIINTYNWTLNDDGPADDPLILEVTVTALDSVTLPFQVDGTYDCWVDFGEGDGYVYVDTWNDTNATHVYAGTGTFDITIQGTRTRFAIDDGAFKNYISDVKQWGTEAYDEINLRGSDLLTNLTCTDILNTTNNPLGTRSFANCNNLETINRMGEWDMSTATNFNLIFDNDAKFNDSGVANWDVSGVLTMQYVFRGCTVFNQDISGWTMTQVTSIEGMFNNANAFSQDISGWNITSNLVNMNFAFSGANNFVADLSSWDTSSVTGMSQTFRSINYAPALDAWDFSSVTTMTLFFQGNTTFSNANYDALLIKIKNTRTNSSVTAGFTNCKYNAGVVDTGTTDGTTTGKLVDSTQNFLTTVTIGDIVYNTTNSTYAEVTAVDSDTTLSIENDIMTSGENYSIQGSAAAKARYELINDFSWVVTDNGPV